MHAKQKSLSQLLYKQQKWVFFNVNQKKRERNKKKKTVPVAHSVHTEPPAWIIELTLTTTATATTTTRAIVAAKLLIIPTAKHKTSGWQNQFASFSSVGGDYAWKICSCVTGVAWFGCLPKTSMGKVTKWRHRSDLLKRQQQIVADHCWRQKKNSKPKWHPNCDCRLGRQQQ